MFSIYAVCAGVGTLVAVFQIAMLLLGADHGMGHIELSHDVHFEGGGADHDHADSSWFFGVVSVRTLTAALAFFGWAGLASDSAGWPPVLGIFPALAAGLCAMFLMAWLMRLLYRLQSDGNVHIENTIGQGGTVYLAIPGQQAGMGKVTVTVQNRTMEYQAVTDKDALPTGTAVVVVDVLGPDTVQVAPVSTQEGE